MTEDRDLDVVVFGATGFVGALVAGYLAEHAPPGARIGLAGRSADRLAAVRDALGDAAAGWPLLVADSADPRSLAVLAGSTRVVATTVGPYARYGLPLVEACARAGTDYVDLTGEVLFVRDCIDRYQEIASRSGARIVNSCGFDSIPSDLAVALLHEQAAADGAGDLTDTLLIATMRGGFSGGTIDSQRAQVEAVLARPELRRVLADPYALSPDRSAEPDRVPGPVESRDPGQGSGPGGSRDPGQGPRPGGSRDPDQGSQPQRSAGAGTDRRDRRSRVRLDAETGSWTGPFVMAPYNTRLVRRSNALRGWAYGRRFRYHEVMSYGRGPAGRLAAAVAPTVLRATTVGFAFQPTRAVLDRVLPSPGSGPDEERRRSGYFRMHIRTATSDGARYRAVISAQGDPGYAATAVMFGEAALCLALDRDRLPDAAGVLTPATALGMPLVDRLRAAGMRWDVERG